MSETQQPTFGIEKIYVKDLSLEVPGGPQTFLQGEQPQLEVQITQQSQRVNELLYEVTLVITVSAKRSDKTLFLVEASQPRRQASSRSATSPMPTSARCSG